MKKWEVSAQGSSLQFSIHLLANTTTRMEIMKIVQREKKNFFLRHQTRAKKNLFPPSKGGERERQGTLKIEGEISFLLTSSSSLCFVRLLLSLSRALKESRKTGEKKSLFALINKDEFKLCSFMSTSEKEKIFLHLAMSELKKREMIDVEVGRHTMKITFSKLKERSIRLRDSN